MADIYKIQIKGHLDADWSAWFDELILICHDDGTMDLVGPVADQAALYGLLLKLRDLGLPLLAVNRVEPERRQLI
jgi:hypothetical protein